MPITLDGSNGITTPMYNGSITANAVTPSVNMKNRIINGAMVIDQRNAGASVSGNAYPVDRFQVIVSQSSKLTAQQNAGSVTPPAGFTNYVGITSSSAYSVISSDYFAIRQFIEGFNIADLGWGSANAKTVTLSFWVRSSLTGTFGGALQNSAQTRAYPYSYTISAANTWEYKTITIAGDTTGTWLTNNGQGIGLYFSLGTGSVSLGTAGAWAASSALAPTGETSVVGTNGATFYITGVQLEVGSTATSFDYRPYGTELALCQRYFEKSYPIETAPAENIATGESFKNGIWTGGEIYVTKINFVITKRATPTITYYRPTQSSTNGRWAFFTSGWNTSTATVTDGSGVNGFNPIVSTSPALTSQNAYLVQGGWTASAEL